MTQSNYRAFVERMIGRYEGGYGWDRGDAGGPTKFGITCYDLAEFDHERMTSMSAWASRVRAMPLSVADQIYATKYAAAMQFDNLAAGKDCVVFDFGVNSGISRSVRYAQIVVQVHEDGVLGPQTLEAINNYNATDFINELCGERLRFLRGLRIWGEFGRGWSSRVSDLRAYSLNLLQPHTLAAMPKKERHEPKELRIPKAFAKAYDSDMMRELRAKHIEPKE
jgi:lysozyme family protein